MSRHYTSTGSISSGSSSAGDHAGIGNGHFNGHHVNGSSSASAAAAAAEKVDTLLSAGQIPIIDLAHSGTDQRPSRAVVQRVAAQLHRALAAKGVVFLVNHGICDELMQRAWSYLDQFCDLPADTQEAYIRRGDAVASMSADSVASESSGGDQGGANHGYIRPGVERIEQAELVAGTGGATAAAAESGTNSACSSRRGSTKSRRTKQPPVELRHAFNICTLSGARLPEEPLPGFRDNVAELAGEFKALAGLLLQALAIGLSGQTAVPAVVVADEFFRAQHSHMMAGSAENETTLRLLYYPPVVEDDNKCEMVRGRCGYAQQRCAKDRLDLTMDDDKDDDDDEEAAKPAMRCGAHCDYGTFTLLAQDSEGGLEVRLPGSERWQRVGHLPGAILMNTGDLLALWTAGQYPALMHRVVVPPQPSLRARGRHSMAFFCHPDNCTAVEPLAALVEARERAEAGGACVTAAACARKPSFKLAKEKVATAYQLIQRRFRKTYGGGGTGNGNSNGNSGNGNGTNGTESG